MRRKGFVVTLSFIVVVSFIATIAQQRQVHPYRLLQIVAGLERKGRHTIVVGDSITHAAIEPDTCGTETFDAGVPGYSVEDWATLLPVVRHLTGAADIVVALGSNDAWPDRGTIDDFSESYNTILDAFGEKVRAIVLIPPFEPKAGRELPDNRRREERNIIIQKLASNRNISLIEVTSMSTIDGLHPDKDGAAAWRQSLSAKCFRLFNQT